MIFGPAIDVANANSPDLTTGGGGGEPPLFSRSARIKLIQNEQAKLSASAVNNVGVAFVVVGIVTPVVAYAQSPSPTTSVLPLVISGIWLLTGAILHLAARLILVSLEP